jgi:hypothetical protein
MYDPVIRIGHCAANPDRHPARETCNFLEHCAFPDPCVALHDHDRAGAGRKLPKVVHEGCQFDLASADWSARVIRSRPTHLGFHGTHEPVGSAASGASRGEQSGIADC